MELYDFYSNFMRISELSDSIIIISFIIIQRILQEMQSKHSSSISSCGSRYIIENSWKKLCLVGIMLSQKVYEDNAYDNRSMVEFWKMLFGSQSNNNNSNSSNNSSNSNSKSDHHGDDCKEQNPEIFNHNESKRINNSNNSSSSNIENDISLQELKLYELSILRSIHYQLFVSDKLYHNMEKILNKIGVIIVNERES